MNKAIVTLLVVIVALVAYTTVLDMKMAREVQYNTKRLNLVVDNLVSKSDLMALVVDDLVLKEAKIKLLKERLEFQNKLVVPMWLYFEHKPKVRVPLKPRPVWANMVADLHRREVK